MQNSNFEDLIAKASDHRRKGQYQSTIDSYKLALKKFPEHTIFCAYNLGALYQTELGYGDIALEYYLKAIDWYHQNPDSRKNDPGAQKELDVIISATYENMTLLSSSYEEFYDWAEKTLALNPGANSLRDNKKKIEIKEKSGNPWKQTYFETANIFWNTDPNKDKGLYGFGASIYRMLLINRKKLRVDRQQYEFCANGYGALMQLIFAKILNVQNNTIGKIQISEIEFILDDVIAVLSLYLKINPNDVRVNKAVEIFKEQKRNYSDHSDHMPGNSVTHETITPGRRVIGETKCHNQIVIVPKDQNELFEIINELSGILLEPFINEPQPYQYQAELQNEFMQVQQLYARGKNISINQNQGSSKSTYCLIGDKPLTAWAWIYNALGMEQTFINNIDLATNYFYKALKDSPGYSFAIYNIATCLAMKGQYNEALNYYEEAYRYYPSDTGIYRELIECRKEIQRDGNIRNHSSSNPGSGCLVSTTSFILIILSILILII